jgi:hypothetical protein
MKRKLTRMVEEIEAQEISKSKSNEIKGDGKIRYINNGGLFITVDNKTIKSGVTFKSRPEDIPAAAKDVIKPLDPVKENKIAITTPQYKIEATEEDVTLFNVVDSRGKAINETPLDEESANAFLNRILD